MKGASRIVAAAAFILWILAMWKSSSVFESKQVPFYPEEGKGEAIPAKEGAAALPNSFSYVEELLKSPYAVSRYKPLLDKNMFIKPEPPVKVFSPEDLTLVSVTAVPLPFMYKGFIEVSDGTIIGQINWSGKTYFVKKGQKVKDYKVTEINSKIVKMENKDGQVTLELKKPAKSKELVAKLHDSMNNKDIEAKKGDLIGEYKVLDIKTDSVVLYGQNKEWVITKGR
ncbi:MAG: hypothetical protein PHX64_03220 [Candidatus Omnitrophica bacterium]|nr:hypothetical protein [Candidatus Omnitrophota bacterium]MDD5310742.1 hypothetical protein [Candidatus Omnitrophota bacterium]MDD5545574.1 hypothetical protein [Candidatus Omnitrophota bacterium]